MALVRTRKIIDDAGASAVIAAAEQEANAHGHRVVIAVVDPHGELIELRRTPGAQIASSRVAVDKARTAAIFVRPSREIEEQVTNGRLGALALHGASALTGGIPLQRGRRGRRRDRHERRDARRGRGDLDRRRGCRVLRGGGRRTHLRGRPARGRGRRRGGRRARRGAGDFRGRRRRRAHVPGAPGLGPGRFGRGDDRQGPHRRDLPAAEQGLRGPGVQWATVRTPPRPRGAAPGRRADRVLRRGDRSDRRERRDRRRRGPRACRAGRPVAPGSDRGPREGGGSDGAAHFPAAAVDEKFRAGGLLLDTGRTRSTRAAARAPARSSTTSASST